MAAERPVIVGAVPLPRRTREPAGISCGAGYGRRTASGCPARAHLRAAVGAWIKEAGVTVAAVERYLFDLKNQVSLQEQLASDRDLTFEGYDLTDSERGALSTGDLEWLWLAGVHPLLLVPFSRFLGISPGEYRTRLSRLQGLRTITSTAVTAPAEGDPR